MTDGSSRLEVSSRQLFASILIACVVAFSVLGAFAWHDQRAKRLAREAAEAAEAARQHAWAMSPRSRIDGITRAHPTTAPRDRLLAAIDASERGVTVCAPLVVQASRANWFFPTRVDELAILLLASDSLTAPVVEWRRRAAGVTSEPRQLIARSSRGETNGGVSFLLFKEHFLDGLQVVDEHAIPRPDPDDDRWLREDDSQPYNDFSGVEVRVRSAAEFDDGDWIAVESLTEEMSERVRRQLRATTRYTRP
jgi:hypothetical protein